MLVSILIPCYNVENYLSQCLDSVVGQTYRDLQIVLVDDGSTDNTLDIAEDYAEKDSRIEIYSQFNQGVASARNTLLSKIKGEYFLFVDSDDWIELDTVEFLLQTATLHEVEMVTCGIVSSVSNIRLGYNKELWAQKRVIKEFLCHTKFNGSLVNKFINVSLLGNNSRFQVGINYGEDALFCWEILKNIKEIVVTDRQLYHYRVTPCSLSHISWTPSNKGSGSLVWQKICEDVSCFYPQYINIAKSRYAIEDMWGIYYASLSNYPYDEEIEKRQKHVRESYNLIKKSSLLSRKKLYFAWICSRWYGIGYILKLFKK